MLKTKRHVNGTVNGRRYVSLGNGTAKRNISGGGQEGLPKHLKKRYKWERIVVYMGIALLGASGIELAIRTADNFIIMLFQISGFLASTVAICIVKHRIGEAIYIGQQLRYAKAFYYMGVCFESLTLLTKYVPGLTQPYLISVAFTLPALIIAMAKIESLDDDIRIYRMEKEGRSESITLRTERQLLNTIIPDKKELATLRAEDNIQDRRNSKMIRKSKGIFAWFKVNDLARKEMKVVYQNIQTKQQKRSTDKLKKSVSDAKVLGERTHKRKQKGPRAGTAANGIYCKNPDCDKKLTGSQRVACSGKCRVKINRLVKKGKLEKTW